MLVNWRPTTTDACWCLFPDWRTKGTGLDWSVRSRGEGHEVEGCDAGRENCWPCERGSIMYCLGSAMWIAASSYLVVKIMDQPRVSWYSRFSPAVTQVTGPHSTISFAPCTKMGLIDCVIYIVDEPVATSKLAYAMVIVIWDIALLVCYTWWENLEVRGNITTRLKQASV